MSMTSMEMYDFLVDVIGLGQEKVDILIQVMGDSKDTYKKILNKTTEFKTFAEAEEYYEFLD